MHADGAVSYAGHSRLTVRAGRALGVVFLTLVAISCLFPVAWMVSTSLKNQSEVYISKSFWPAHPEWSNYARAWQEAHLGVYFANSLLYLTVVVFLTLLIGSLAAYGLSRLEMPGRAAIYNTIVASLMVPLPAAFVPVYVILLQLHLIDTRAGYVLPLIAGGLPLSIFVLKGFFDQTPRELEEAAIMDGANKWCLYSRIVMPLARPALATILILTSLSAWNDYLLALVILTSQRLMPVQVGLMVFQGTYFTRYEMLMAGTTIALAPIALLYILAQKQIIGGLSAGALKG